jgi:hypothetical protein
MRRKWLLHEAERRDTRPAHEKRLRVLPRFNLEMLAGRIIQMIYYDKEEIVFEPRAELSAFRKMLSTAKPPDRTNTTARKVIARRGGECRSTHYSYKRRPAQRKITLH